MTKKSKEKIQTSSKSSVFKSETVNETQKQEKREIISRWMEDNFFTWKWEAGRRKHFDSLWINLVVNVELFLITSGNGIESIVNMWLIFNFSNVCNEQAVVTFPAKKQIKKKIFSDTFLFKKLWDWGGFLEGGS